MVVVVGTKPGSSISAAEKVGPANSSLMDVGTLDKAEIGIVGIGRPVEGGGAWKQVSSDAVEHALNHGRSDRLGLKVCAESVNGSLVRLSALAAVEDVVVGLMECLAPCTSMIDAKAVIFGTYAHDFVCGPEFEGEFCCSSATSNFLAVHGFSNGFPVDEVKSGRIPSFLFDDVASEIARVALVKEVGVEFTCRRVTIDENVGHSGRKNGRHGRGTTIGAGVSQGAGGVAHAVDAYWR